MNGGKTFLALITGLVAGAALGILFAPDKGSETRRKLSGSAKDLSDQGLDVLNNWKEKFSGQGHAHSNGNGHAKKASKSI
jgi:gas vesicle protein